MGALCFCAPIRALRRDAGCRRDPHRTSTFMDRGRHGRGSIGGNGIQPTCRRYYRCCQPTNPDAGVAGRDAFAAIRGVVHVGRLRGVHLRGITLESSCAIALADGACRIALVFLYKKVHALVSPGARIRSGHRSIGGVDRGARLARSENPDSHRGRYVLGGRIRRALCMPGLRVRSRLRAAFCPAIYRDSESA